MASYSSSGLENEGPSYVMSLTGDGSPTLLYSETGQPSEKMHSEAGALSETQFIYGRAVDHVLKCGWPLQFTVLGLGLGYIEMMIAAKALGRREVAIRSYESNLYLRENFAKWVKGEVRELPKTFLDIYEKILALSAEQYCRREGEVRQFLKQIFENGNMQLCDDVRSPGQPFLSGAILFDAFSSQTSSELWTEEFLVAFLRSHSGGRTVFSTYAATGILKRSLNQLGFTCVESPGFAGKRESTFALRVPRGQSN